MSVAPGTFLGPYELLALIGSGGMGEVYRARDPRLRRDVALKILQAHDRGAVARFQTEARAVAAITHPNIMAVHDYGEADGVAYVVYELLEGESLRARILRGPLPWRQAVEIAADVANGLAAAHAKGIVHGDVKPENIFITRDGRVMLVDFGLARVSRSSNHHHQTEPLDLSGAIYGTLAYMAPEVLSGEKPDAAADIYALGCVLAESTVEVPAEIAAIVERCLSKRPSDRFGSARDLALTLRTLTASSTRLRVVPPPPGGSRRALWIAAVLAVVAIVAGVMASRERGKETLSIAVLPFEDAAGDQYIADGLTENLISTLSQVPELSVRARSSVFKLKGQPPERAARELDADYIVTGRIRRRDGSVTVSAELVHPRDQRQIWGGGYDTHDGQFLGIQEEMARDILTALNVTVSDPVRERISARMPSNTAAYELYLRGRFHLNQRTGESFMRAIGFFARAIERDPAYALAYSGLADCYTLLNGYGLRPPEEVVPKAKAAAARALELDPGLAEAHTTLAAIHANHDFDWKAAEAGYRRAIALNPSYVTARQWYGGFLTGLGRFDEAMTQLETARRLDPLSVIVPVQIGLRYYFERRYDDAIRAFESVFELAPDFPTAHEYLALAYAGKGDYARAVAEDVQSRRARKAPAAEIEAVRRAFAEGGYAAYQRVRLGEMLERRRKKEYVSSVEVAMLLAALGQHDRAIEELNGAVAQRASGVIWIKLEPRLDPLRRDPRFQALVARMF